MAPGVVNSAESPEQIAPEPHPAGATMSTTQLWSLSGKTVAITGGARGIGITLAMAVVESGGSVACLDILETPAPAEWAQLQKLASAHKVVASYSHCDVTDEKAVEAVMESVAAKAEHVGSPFWGTIACAGIQQMIPALEYPALDFERILKVNVTGVFNTCKYAARILHRAKRSGSIVIIASMSGNIANRVSDHSKKKGGLSFHDANTLPIGPLLHSIQHK